MFCLHLTVNINSEISNCIVGIKAEQISTRRFAFHPDYSGCLEKDLEKSKRDCWASMVAQLVKNPPAMQKTPV